MILHEFLQQNGWFYSLRNGVFYALWNITFLMFHPDWIIELIVFMVLFTSRANITQIEFQEPPVHFWRGRKAYIGVCI